MAADVTAHLSEIALCLGMAPPSTEVLRLLIEQIDAKHSEGHLRLRKDITEGFIAVDEQMERLTLAQRADHDTLITQRATRERRRELSASRAVIIAAAIGSGSQLIIALVMQIVAFLRGHP